MTNNKSDISTKIVQNGKETTADTAPETSWVPKNPPPAADKAETDRRVGSISHVGALKDRVDHQVVVRKARCGGSTVELIV